jgi:CubicO group peptidase (beta-lactamase class C family)
MTIADIDAALAAAAARVPGLVALATTRDGTIYEGAFGVRDLASGAKMTVDTVFRLASMTKALTSVAAMQLVEAGRLSLDAPVREVLPALATPFVLTGFDAAGQPQTRRTSVPITLRQLLTHSAGYGYNTWNPLVKRWLDVTGAPRLPTNDAELAAYPLVFDPGTRWQYSIATDLVGRAVEAAGGQTLDAYWRDHVFAPLGMVDTGVTLSEAQRARAVRSHVRRPDGSLVPDDQPIGSGPAWCLGGGALAGTARDYGAFLRMMLNGGVHDGTRVLRAETVAEMSRNQIGALDVETLHSVMPDRSNDVDVFPGMQQKWGLGFLINTQAGPAGRSAGSLAWAGLFNTYYWIDPTRGVAGLVLTQILPFMDAGTLAALAAFERAVYASLNE